jgi:hypothetical protein
MLESNLSALTVPAGATAGHGLDALRETPEEYWSARSRLPWT